MVKWSEKNMRAPHTHLPEDDLGGAKTLGVVAWNHTKASTRVILSMNPGEGEKVRELPEEQSGREQQGVRRTARGKERRITARIE